MRSPRRPRSAALPAAWRWRLAALVALSAATLLAPRAARAELVPLAEQDLASVQGQAAFELRRDDDRRLHSLPGLGGLMFDGLLASDMKLGAADRASLDEVLTSRGFTPLNDALYDGGAIVKMALGGAPRDVSFDASRLLLANTGLAYQGASMGTITLHNIDVRGTTLFMFGH
jgi:hypothetical protein